jgi:hypothetical protein
MQVNYQCFDYEINKNLVSDSENLINKQQTQSTSEILINAHSSQDNRSENLIDTSDNG